MRYKKNIKSNIDQCNIGLINLVLQIGDSNTKGDAPVPVPVPTNYQGPISAVKIYAKNNLTSTDNGAWASIQQGVNEMPSYTTPYNAYGESMSLAYELGAYWRKDVGIIKLGIGGSSLVANVPNGSSFSWHSTSGSLWQIYRDYYLAPAISKLAALGYTQYKFRVAEIGFGTNDVLAGNYDLSSFTSQIPIFVANLRTATSTPNLQIDWYLPRTDLQNRPDPYSDPPAGSVAATRQVLIDCATVGHANYIPYFTVRESDGDPSDLIFDGTHYIAVKYDARGVEGANKYKILGD